MSIRDSFPEPDEFGMLPPLPPPEQLPEPEQAPEFTSLPPNELPELGRGYRELPRELERYADEADLPGYLESTLRRPYTRMYNETYEEMNQEHDPHTCSTCSEFPFVGARRSIRFSIEKKPEPRPDPYPSRAGWREPFVPPHDPYAPEEKAEAPKGKIGDYEIVESHTTFNDVGGNERAKGLLQEIAHQFENPELYEKWDVPVPKGVLLWGEPGTGKTMLARAFAGEAGAAFVEIPVASLRDKFYGETEKNLKEIFDKAAEYGKPVVLFFDEINALLPERSRMDPTHPDARLVETFLQAVDGLQSAKNVMVLGATNHPGKIDAAAQRPGRLDQKVEVELPNRAACEEIFAKQLLSSERKAGRVLADDELALQEIGGYLEGLTGAHIAELLNRVKRTMAQTERAMGASTVAVDSAVEAIAFGRTERDALLITTADVIAMAINYRLDMLGISPNTTPGDDEPPTAVMF